ncbi:MAG TPA: hypothetical protein VG265_02175, partial [Gaiellaceae bacterium]|nr:hypothetical protein [Gaiellaceae bacterium]
MATTNAERASTEIRARKVGRGVFLGTVLAGVSSLYWGKAAWAPISSILSPLESEVPLIPTKGWRIYTVSGSLPSFDRKTWKLQLGGHVEQGASIGYE